MFTPVVCEESDLDRVTRWGGFCHIRAGDSFVVVSFLEHHFNQVAGCEASRQARCAFVQTRGNLAFGV